MRDKIARLTLGRTQVLRLQISLFKLFLIVTAYATAYASLSPLDFPGITIATIIGTAASLVVVLVCSRKQLISLVVVTCGTVLGTITTVGFCAPALMGSPVGCFIILMLVGTVGAITGALLFSRFTK